MWLEIAYNWSNSHRLGVGSGVQLLVGYQRAKTDLKYNWCKYGGLRKSLQFRREFQGT